MDYMFHDVFFFSIAFYFFRYIGLESHLLVFQTVCQPFTATEELDSNPL